MQISAIFENEHFVAVDKPAGTLTVPGRTGASDERLCLSHELAKTGPVLPIHRLDVEVSGLVLFAKNTRAHREANAWFEARHVHKSYEAWTEGTIPDGSNPGQTFEWQSNILRGKRRAYESPHGKPAITRATWLGSERFHDIPIQRWQLEPLTGRSHQLRFELSRHGFPILGDTLYGAHVEFIAHAIALRSIRLDFSGCAGAAKLGLPEVIQASSLREAFCV